MAAIQLNKWPIIGTCVLTAWAALAAPAAKAKKISNDSSAFNAAVVAGDPTSPINPFNGGADPMTMPGDARIGVFPYSRDQIYRVLTAPLKITTIELEKGEMLIADSAMGDSIHWEIDEDKMNHVFIKPHKADLVNTLHLTTNRREYDFTLIASSAGGMFYQFVRFQYPHAPMARVSARSDATGNSAAGSGVTGNDSRSGTDSGSISIAPDKLNWDYSVGGRAEFTPETVFDDGRAVWMRMPAKAQEWPVRAVHP
ncbi:Conjugative transfer protein TrbG [Candidatus Burkholderia pumila]|uniref:Conjugative transfer protein TrbG n=1 Tax=Candidatus Burkholderia pumila TaxID=1090375 RepID=A0ABR5HKM6_9BURK|nr:Conjugative transfer protein TrbG [Candidatus Burkholderia pumila]